MRREQLCEDAASAVVRRSIRRIDDLDVCIEEYGEKFHHVMQRRLSPLTFPETTATSVRRVLRFSRVDCFQAVNEVFHPFFEVRWRLRRVILEQFDG